MIQSSVPIHFWGDYILTTTYTINRLPNPLLHNKSPHDILFMTSPDYSHLRAFGCLCYISTATEPSTKKFHPKAQPCIFLGYPYAQKVFKFYNVKVGKCHISRDVVLFEHIFPYSQLHTQQMDTSESLSLSNVLIIISHMIFC